MIEFCIEVAVKIFMIPYDYLNIIGDAMGEVVSNSGNSIISSINSTIGGQVTTFFPVIQSIAFAISIMFWLFNLIDLMMTDRFNLETFVKSFGHLALAVGMISLTPTFFTTLQDFGTALASLTSNHFRQPGSVLDSSTIQTSLTKGFENAVDAHDNFIGKAIDFLTPDSLDVAKMGKAMVLVGVALLTAAPVLFGALIMVIVVYFIGFSRIIEINVRGAFLPIGLALLSDDGFKGAGGRYLKRFIAVCCQGIVIAMIGVLYRIMYGAAITNMATDLSNLGSIGKNYGVVDVVSKMLGAQVVIFGVGVACISALFKSIQLTNDIFGA